MQIVIILSVIMLSVALFIVMLSVFMLCHNAECNCVVFNDAECRYGMLSLMLP